VVASELIVTGDGISHGWSRDISSRNPAYPVGIPRDPHGIGRGSRPVSPLDNGISIKKKIVYEGSGENEGIQKCSASKRVEAKPEHDVRIRTVLQLARTEGKTPPFRKITRG